MVFKMTHGPADYPNQGKKPVPVALGKAGIVISSVFGLVMMGFVIAPQAGAQSAQPALATMPSFEVASIKLNRSGDGRMMFQNTPGRFVVNNANAKFLIEFAYNIKDFQLSGGPSWINTDRYDIDAKMEDSAVEAMQKLPPDKRQEQIRLMIQSLLADRFQLRVERGTKELPAYALIVAKGGPKLTETPDQAPAPAGSGSAPAPPPGPAGVGGGGGGGRQGPTGFFRIGRGQMNLSGADMTSFASMLSGQAEIGRPVIDETGLKGNYEIAWKWTPDSSTQSVGGDASQSSASAPPVDTSGPNLFTALQDQLGLKLESRKAPAETIGIARIEKPSDN
jgi:bla regulator protein blaR1